MTRFKDLLMTIPIEIEDRLKFIEDCRTWNGYVEVLKTYDMLTTMKLIKYFITERMSAKRMLVRAIMRFNTLNRLTRRHLK